MNLSESQDASRVANPAGMPPAWILWGSIATVVLCLLPSFLALAELWTTDEGGSHGSLVFPVSLWLIWREFRERPGEQSRPSVPASACLLLAVLACLSARAASIAVVELTAAIASIWFAIAAAMGWSWARRMLFPVAYLLTAVPPLWEPLRPVLQGMTVWATGHLVQLSGIPAYIRGDFVEVPGGTFEIALGCSGAHLLVAAIALALLYGWLAYSSWWPRLWLLAGMVLLSLVANWIRVYLIIRVGYLTNMQHPWITEGHYSLGWVIFGVSLVPFLLLGSWLARFDKVPPVASGPHQPAQSPGHFAWPLLLLAFAATIVPVAVVRSLAALRSPATGQDLAFPLELGAWHTAPGDGGVWRPHFPGATFESVVRYRAPAGEVAVYVNWFATQRQGAELIGHGSTILGENMERANESRRNWAGARWQVFEAQTQTGKQWLIASQYRVGGRIVSSALMAKLTQGLSGLLGDTGAGVVAVATPCVPDCQSAEFLLESFAQDAARHPIGL